LKGTIEAKLTVSFSVIMKIFFSFYLTKAEMLALTKEDVDFQNNQISITKTYYRTERRDIITTPKTEQSVRVIDIPQFLTKEIEMYVSRCYGLPDNERLFPIVAEAVQHKLKRACVKSGVKPIRVHDLRHSHVAYLINQGVQPLIINLKIVKYILKTSTDSHPKFL
jgi:integrase